MVTAAALLCPAVSDGVAAQSVLRGVVRSASDGALLPGVEIASASTRPSVRTSAVGAYLLPLPTGLHRVLARYVGYAPVEVEVEVGAADTVEADFELSALAVQLDPLVTTAAPRLGPGMDLFESRRREGFGAFLTREDLERRDNSTLSGVLRGIPGTRMIRMAPGGVAVASSRGQVGIALPAMDQGVPTACYMQVMVDDVRIWAWSSGRPPDIDGYAPRDLQAVEIYAGPAQTPAELSSSGSWCGTIVLRTRVR